MASITICDFCGKELKKPFYKLRIYKAEENQESRDMKTVGNMEFHSDCFRNIAKHIHDHKNGEQPV